ncbi:ferritin-like domain-containing protein [Kitasatospora sp. RG8]|uniref:ferritin-like domain-containing protein n=1 Tax=Kitasatospora sp. RG8 TaxID=2820815 RepID=UPI001ADF3868|nr:ferritin-like domain-containing protein [Kitasatospora sp. RG8]MBP0454968.1 ferritin-like domain-containing protein [Kitasatospora sp. RG8]
MQPPSRRTFLALGLLLTTGGALTACTDSHDGKDATEGERRRPDPDEPVRLRAVAATDTLLAGYDALLAGPGAGQAAQLQPLRAEVAQHRAALAGAQASPSAAPASATPGSASPSASSTGAAASAVTSTAALASLERQTAQTRLADLGAASPQLARLLASVSTAGVLHAVALGDTAPPTVPAPGPASASPSASGSPSPSSSGAGSSASGSPSAAPSGAGGAPAVGPEAVTAFQAALSAEHAAIYGYGVVGARLPEDQQRADARTALAAHQTRRDAWQRLLGGVGATPNAAAAGYQLPFPVTDGAAAGRLAAHIETRLTTVYADLVAAVDGTQRTTAADALRECALRARHWGAAPTAFPGIPDPATAPASGTPTAAPTPAATG